MYRRGPRGGETDKHNDLKNIAPRHRLHPPLLISVRARRALVILPLLAVILLIPHLVLRIYTDNLELIDASVPALMVMSSAYLIQTSAFIWFNTVSGTGNTRAAFTLEMAAIISYALYVYYIVIHLKADVAWCWTSEHLYGIVMFTLAFLYMCKADWRSKKI